MKPINIYIDHAFDPTVNAFVKSFEDRLKSIKQDFTISSTLDESADPREWENITLKCIDNADIIIAIINSTYLGNITRTIEDKFNKIIESKNKYFFPILFSSASWLNYNWIVKSKLIPEGNKPFTEYSYKAVESIMNDFILTINNIISKRNISLDFGEGIEVIKALNSEIVFISHDHEDADFAELLKMYLEKQGIIGWIDKERLKIGQDWREEIDDGIIKSVAVIAVMTPEARKSEYVTYEWAFAWGKGKRIFPIMLKQTQLHPRLESLQYLDFTNRNTRPYDILISSIKELMGLV